ncbi:MAG TPA: alpha/beta fold hydrolase [Aestuariivirga sp.]|nr:alpha/beta fold hydrolase [Aestuariivirga sp.]
MPLPRLGETMEEGRIGRFFKHPGEKFRRGEMLLEVETDKTTVEVPALQDGVLIEWLVKVDGIVPVDSAVARIEIEGEALAEVKKSAPPPLSSPLQHAAITNRRGSTMRPRASTAARAAARKSGIDLATLTGSGRGGRIMSADLVQKTRTTYHMDTPHGCIFIREWPAQGAAKGTALLIHGLFSDSQSFVTLGRMLGSKGFRTLAVDLPGHGETRSKAATVADIVAAVSAALPPGKLHIAGHSLGAIVAAHLAERAQSLTLLSPLGTGEEISADFVTAMLGGNVGEALGYLGEKLPPSVKTGLKQHLSANVVQLRAIAASVAGGGRQTISILARLASLTLPVSAIYMRGDAIVPSHHALNLPSNVSVRFLQGAGHLPHWRDPELVARVIATQC